MYKNPSYFIFLLLLGIVVWQCNPDEDLPEIVEPEEPIVLEVEKGEELSGGQATVFDVSENAFGFQAPGLSNQNQLLFFVGNSFFNQNWVTAPASTTARDGLGPFFNARSCASCHFKDGRGEPLVGEKTQRGKGLLLRISVPGVSRYGGPLPEPTYGTQISDRSIDGIESEAHFIINYKEQPGQYPDGETYSLRAPDYELMETFYGDLDPQVLISPRIAPQMIGLGLLEAIDESSLLANADEFDVDKDGISGKPNYVWDFVHQQVSLGRFGWKANEPNLLQQTAGAFLGDLGITSYLFSEENCVEGLDCNDIPNGGEKEIDDHDLEKTVLYSSSLAVPARRDWEDETVLKGKQLFNKINCSSCHVPKYTTGQHHLFPAFSNQEIWPYTDLLLHDMGPGLADNRPEFDATGREWRTPPLWGIGLFPVVNDHSFYLHDGRARNLEEAILWHGGEAEASKKAFMTLTKEDRDAIIQFLNSL
ncbi:MAG: di-heme oxidoredictase family protein [Bacteroidota bacterium]